MLIDCMLLHLLSIVVFTVTCLPRANLTEEHRRNVYLVGDNPELALLGVWALLQHIVDQCKKLLHDCILTHVVMARLDLQ